jgi:hypothetical protein
MALHKKPGGSPATFPWKVRRLCVPPSRAVCPWHLLALASDLSTESRRVHSWSARAWTFVRSLTVAKLLAESRSHDAREARPAWLGCVMTRIGASLAARPDTLGVTWCGGYQVPFTQPPDAAEAATGVQVRAVVPSGLRVIVNVLVLGDVVVTE